MRYNIGGIKSILDFFAEWNISLFTFKLTQKFAKHLIDYTRFDDDIDIAAKNMPILLKMAVNAELSRIGCFIPKKPVDEILADALDEHIIG